MLSQDQVSNLEVQIVMMVFLETVESFQYNSGDTMAGENEYLLFWLQLL